VRYVKNTPVWPTASHIQMHRRVRRVRRRRRRRRFEFKVDIVSAWHARDALHDRDISARTAEIKFSTVQVE